MRKGLGAGKIFPQWCRPITTTANDDERGQADRPILCVVSKSGRALPHSKTWPPSQAHFCRLRLGVRRCSAAFKLGHFATSTKSCHVGKRSGEGQDEGVSTVLAFRREPHNLHDTLQVIRAVVLNFDSALLFAVMQNDAGAQI